MSSTYVNSTTPQNARWSPQLIVAHQVLAEMQRAAAAATIEDFEWLISCGESPVEAARRLGYEKPHSLARRLVRQGRRDLARGLWEPYDVLKATRARYAKVRAR